MEFPKVYTPLNLNPLLPKCGRKGLYAPQKSRTGKHFTSLFLRQMSRAYSILDTPHARSPGCHDTISPYEGWWNTWVPGTDHAGIATIKCRCKSSVKRWHTSWRARARKIRRKNLGMERNFSKTITDQMRMMGAKCFAHHERFTRWSK